jgi:hypothetical protein
MDLFLREMKTLCNPVTMSDEIGDISYELRGSDTV